MIRLIHPTKVTREITITPPGAAAGVIQVEIKYLTISEHVRYLQSVRDASIEDDQVLDDMLVGWQGITDENDQALLWADTDARRRVLDEPYVYHPIRDAILNELFHREGDAKN